MARKISNQALIATLVGAKRLLDASIKQNKWLVATVLPAASWKDVAAKLHEINSSLDVIENASRIIRDIDHALAALEQEKDSE